jgi:hypothetical protein
MSDTPCICVLQQRLRPPFLPTAQTSLRILREVGRSLGSLMKIIVTFWNPVFFFYSVSLRSSREHYLCCFLVAFLNVEAQR